MAKKGKNNQTDKQSKQGSRQNNSVGDYDVKESIKKFHSYNSRKKDNGYSSTNSFSPSERQSSNSVINSNINTTAPTDSGSLFHEYNRLDDKITNITTQNELAHNELRKELEGKIKNAKEEIEEKLSSIKETLNNKLSSKWFKAAVTILVAIAGLIYTLSYSRQMDAIDKNASELSTLKQNSARVEKDLEYIKKDIKELKDITTKRTIYKQNNK